MTIATGIGVFLVFLALAWCIYRDTEFDLALKDRETELALAREDRDAAEAQLLEQQAWAADEIGKRNDKIHQMECEVYDLKEDRTALVAAVQRLEEDLAGAKSRLSRKRKAQECSNV